MKVLIDIGHPAHVHYFKFLIQKIYDNGGEVKVISREKEVTHTLLNAYHIPFVSRGKGGEGLFGKFFYLLYATRFLKKSIKSFQPDIVLSFASPYASKAAYKLNIPHVAIDDTEHATFARRFYLKYTTKVLTPKSFNVKLGKKHFYFDGFMELCYLHPAVFRPDKSILTKLNLTENQPFILLRFVSFKASHDLGQFGMSLEFKLSLINQLKEKGFTIFISSEFEIPKELEEYRLKIAPQEMHDLLYFASGFIGEGATMASECAMMGTPAIYINTLDAGTLQEQEKMGLIKNCRTELEVQKDTLDWLMDANCKQQTRRIIENYFRTIKPPTDLIYNELVKTINR